MKAFERILESPALAADLVPKHLRWLGPLGVAFAQSTVRGLAKKYQVEYSEADVLAKLDTLRTAIKAAPGDYLLEDRFTYAGK